MALTEGREKGLADAPKKADRDKSTAESDLDTLRKSLAEFETKSGIKIDQYDGGYIGEIVAKLRLLQSWNTKDPTRPLKQAADALDMYAKQLRQAQTQLTKELKLVTEEDPIVEVANG